VLARYNHLVSPEHFAALVRRIARGVARVEREQVCCGDVTWQQFDTLRAVHERGAMTTGALARHFGIDLSTASRNLAVLERGGYLARVRDRDDARHVANRLTAKGRRCVESLRCDERVVYGAIAARVSPAHSAQVLEALALAAAALEAGGAPDTDAAACCPAPATDDAPTDAAGCDCAAPAAPEPEPKPPTVAGRRRLPLRRAP
jgi:DNA-binding MarR family transcriptional regulator